MQRNDSATTSFVPAGGSSALDLSRALRIGVLLLGVLVSARAALAIVDAPSLVPMMWPAAGLMAGLLLTSPRRARPSLLLGCFVLVLGAHLGHGYSWGVALGFTVSAVAAVWVVRRRLVAGLDGRRAALLEYGDVSRMIGAIAVGSTVAALGYGLTDWVSGNGNPWLGAIAAFGANASSLMILLPLFMETLSFEPLADGRERLVQSVLTIGTTFLVFGFADAPPVVFAVMPMFAWLGFRGTLREATILLTVVGVIGTGMTVAGLGPIWGLGERYDLAPELVGAVLQLFLLDCGLILLPLSVIVTQSRKAAARADAERETLQRIVASATGTVIIATGRDGRISLFNPGAEEVLGYSAEEVLGRLPDFLHSEEELRQQATSLRALPNYADLCRASVATGDAKRLWHFLRSDGEERTLRMTLTAVPDERGELSGYLATAEDVTEREEAERALLLTLQHQRAAVEQLRELERVKAEFVSTVSHELRTPITSIVGYTELLEDGMIGDLSHDQLEVIERVERNARRLLLLVEDLLTLSQIESSALSIDPVTTDLRAVVTGAYDALGLRMVDRDLDVVVTLPADPVCQQADPVQLERMVLNLLTNALKFTPDGGTVEVRLRDLGDCSQIVVIDTGIGIPASEQEKLFTRFFRSSTATDRAIQGTGLGLTIVQAVVALHGGEVEVESTYEVGTTVTVTLPRALAAVG